MNSHKLGVRLLVAVIMGAAFFTDSGAEVNEVRVARGYGVGFVPLMIMEDQRLIEKHAKKAGLGEVSVKWATISGAAAVNDALLAGQLDFAQGGPQALIILWARTKGSLDVRGVAALNTIPMYLNTRNPNVKTIKDFTEKDKIALPSVKVSSQALALQMAAAQVFGESHYHKLDPLTVAVPHPEALVALLSGGHEINSHFTTPPFAFQELEAPGIRLVLNSDEVFGGPTTLNVIWTTGKFHDANPKIYNAYQQALEEAIAFIDRDTRASAATYLKMSRDKKNTVESIEKQLRHPDIKFMTTPKNFMKYATFMFKVGIIKVKPSSWNDLFFPEVHHLPGS